MRWYGFLSVLLIAGMLTGHYTGSVNSHETAGSTQKATFIVR